MNPQRIERTIVVTIGSRLALVAIAVANWDKASWAFQQWSRSGALQADIMAGAIEAALVIFTYMLAQRLQANARRLKSDPARPTKTLWVFVAFLSFLSAFCNGLYFVHFGKLADPLGNVLASIIAGIILGLAAPLLAGGIAYLQGEETATEISLEEAEERRRLRNEKRRERRKLRKQQAEDSVKSRRNSGEISEEPTEDSVQIGDLTEKTRDQLVKTVKVYAENPTASLGDLAEVLGVGTSRASEIRSTAERFRLLERVSAREFSPNGGEISAVISVD
jgi:uncharacterized membrane protein